MYEKRDLLQSLSSFRSLDSFRHSLNAVQSLADFSLDCTREFLAYADRIERDVVIHNDECSDDAVLSDTEFERIRQLATRKRRNRLAFFNGEEGKRLRLSTSMNKNRKDHLCSVLFVVSGDQGHRSTFKCASCSVHLCIRVYPGFRKSCWTIWHSARSLEPRIFPSISSSPSQEASAPRSILRRRQDAQQGRASQRQRTSSD